MRLPKYSKHASGKARVRYKGKDIYLPGPYGSEESLAAYKRLCDHIRAEQASKSNSAASRPVTASRTVAQLLDEYMAHAAEYYADSPAELGHLEAVKRLLILRHATLPADQFTPLLLAQLRDMMIAGGWKYESGRRAEPWCRITVNHAISRIKRIFRWGVSKMLVQPNTLAALEALDSLRSGRTAAAESEPVRPVAWEVVEQTLPELRSTITDMVRFQWHTGMRSKEICRMTATGLHLDREASDGVWVYCPTEHKTRRRGKERVVVLGPVSIGILKPRLTTKLDVPLFPIRKAATPHTMRHSFATSMLEAGVDVLTISKLLGHSSFVTTMIYLHVRRQHFDRSPSPIDWLPVRQCPKWAEESLSQSILPQPSEPPTVERTHTTEVPDNTPTEESPSPVRRTSGRKPRKRRRK